MAGKSCTCGPSVRYSTLTTWATSCEVQSQSYKVQSQSYKVQSQSYKVQSQSYKVQSQSYKVQSQSYKVQSQSYKVQLPADNRIAIACRAAGSISAGGSKVTLFLLGLKLYVNFRSKFHVQNSHIQKEFSTYSTFPPACCNACTMQPQRQFCLYHPTKKVHN